VTEVDIDANNWYHTSST